MNTTGPPIKDPESIDLPSSWKRQKSFSDKLWTTFWTAIVWILLVFVSVAFFSAAFSEGVDVTREYIAAQIETRGVIRPAPRPTPRATPTASPQDVILTYKILLRSQLREEGMLLGECGTFRCSKRWNAYMDAEIMRLLGK